MICLITGGQGLLGSAIVQAATDSNISVCAIGSHDYDLREQAHVRAMYHNIHPDIVYHCAALVGGIWANANMKGKFFYENTIMNTLVFEEARRAGVKRMVAMGSGCMYPRRSPIPTPESLLWDGPPEKTNEPYAIAKRMLVTQSDAYYEEYGFSSAVAVLSNLYGPRDNFHPDDSHVVPALIRKFVEAKQNGTDVTIWGTGNITRDFLYIDDAAKAILAIGESNLQGPVNVGSGTGTSLWEIISLIAEHTKFSGDIMFDISKPDGEPHKCLSTKILDSIGFKPQTSLAEGIKSTVQWYIENQSSIRSQKK
jgi:GDP-L-fucose synthase